MRYTHYRMHYNNIFIIALLCCLMAIVTVSGQEGQGGTESNLSKGYGARAMGLGNAYTALADDPTAVFWNPAGLEFLYRQSVTLFHTSYWEGTSYDFLGYAHPTLRLGTFGVGIGRIGVGEIPIMDNSGLPLGNASFEEMQFYFSYAKRFAYNITPGITVRMAHRGWSNLQESEDLSDTGFGLDLGLMYRPEWYGSPYLQDWAFGLKVHNFVSPNLNEGSDADDFPLTVKLGLMKKIRFAGGQYFNALLDIDYSQRRDLRLHLGTEYRFRELGEVRLGYDAGGIAFGAGVEYLMFQFDYAYGYNSSYSDYFSAVHRVSLTIDFGYNRDELFEIAEEKRIAEEEKLIQQVRAEETKRFIADHLKTGDDYFAQQRYLDAIVEYQQVLSRDSTHTRAMAMVDSANVRIQQDISASQESAIRDALDKERVKTDQEFVNQHLQKGLSYLDQNKLQEALVEFNLALERDGGNATVLGAIQTTQRRTSEEVARLILQSREELKNQNFSEALVRLADARALGGGTQRQQQEIETITNQIHIQRDVQRGMTLFQIGEYNQALQIFEAVLAKDPQNDMAKEFYERSKIETVGKDVKMDAQTEKRYLEGVEAYLAGDYSQAVQIWEEILVEQPYNKKVLESVQRARERMK
jgi:tetratricopeptide (TPR) repeat protein